MDGSVGMGAWDGSGGMGAWGQESGDGIVIRTLFSSHFEFSLIIYLFLFPSSLK